MPTETSPATTAHTEDHDRSPAASHGDQLDHSGQGHEPASLPRREHSQPTGRYVRGWVAQVGWVQLLLGGLGGLAVLDIGAGLTGSIASLLLLSIGIAMLYGSFALLTVVLLRIDTVNKPDTAPTWARRKRPPIYCWP